MPIEDSAGTGVYLIDKSQRAAQGAGFRAAVVIETQRGLCNTPVLISSEDAFTKIFGTPSIEECGKACAEAYYMAQSNVPMVIVRAKNPELTPQDNIFGLLSVSNGAGGISFNTAANANKIQEVITDNICNIYFKGEGDYCSKAKGNIVLRFSKPIAQSAYASEDRVFQVQVYDFDGLAHIDTNTDGKFSFNPYLDDVVDSTGHLYMDGYDIPGADSGSGTPVSGNVNGTITLYVNGLPVVSPFTKDDNIYEVIVEMLKGIADPSDPDKKMFPEGNVQLDEYNRIVIGAGEYNCFNLTVSAVISAEADAVAHEGSPANNYVNVAAGNISVSAGTATFTLGASMILMNRDKYMYMASDSDPTGYWAACYSDYCRETFVASFSQDDYDGNYNTMKADAVMASSRYLVVKESESFSDYKFDFSAGLFENLIYFDSASVTVPTLKSNKISAGSRSYAYKTALQRLLGDNLTKWRCVCTPNLGDVMTAGDYNAAIAAAGECSLGLSNIGVTASRDALNESNLQGRHGNRFVSDYSQYGLINLNGRKTYVTMACLATILLNRNYRNGNEARPPFGPNYGQVMCDGLSQEFTGPERKWLAQVCKINPVLEDGGYFIWEDITSQKAETALSDTHSILSYCWMKFRIYDSMKSFVAEYNDPDTVKRGLDVLNDLRRDFIAAKYIQDAIANADGNVIGDKVIRFNFKVRFKGVGRYVDVYVTAYSQTQTLEISLAQEA